MLPILMLSLPKSSVRIFQILQEQSLLLLKFADHAFPLYYESLKITLYYLNYDVQERLKQ